MQSSTLRTTPLSRLSANKVDMRRPCVIDRIYRSPDGNTFTAPKRQAIRSACPSVREADASMEHCGPPEHLLSLMRKPALVRGRYMTLTAVEARALEAVREVTSQIGNDR